MAAPSVEVSITTKDGKSSTFSESVTDMTGKITLPVLKQVLSKMQREVNSSLTLIVETAKKSGSQLGTSVGDNGSDVDELDENDEDDDEDEQRQEKRKYNEELECQKVAKVR